MVTWTWTRGGEQTSHVSVKWILTFLFHSFWKSASTSWVVEKHYTWISMIKVVKVNGHFNTYIWIYFSRDRKRERAHYLTTSKGCEGCGQQSCPCRQLGVSITCIEKFFNMLKFPDKTYHPCQDLCCFRNGGLHYYIRVIQIAIYSEQSEALHMLFCRRCLSIQKIANQTSQ